MPEPRNAHVLRREAGNSDRKPASFPRPGAKAASSELLEAARRVTRAHAARVEAQLRRTAARQEMEPS